MYSNGYNAYKANSVNFASKEQLLLMLVDGAVKFSKIARQAMIDRDIKKSHNAIIRTQDIFTELRVSLDINSGKWASQMFEVYGFINEKLMEANIKKDVEILNQIIPLIEEVRNIWYAAEKKAKSY